MLSNVMVGINTYAKDMEFNEDMVRHMILNSLRSYRTKFGPEYGELILCYDAPNSWRKEVFPFYKANRKKKRNADSYDWNAIFKYLNQIKAEIHENFPYAFIQVDRAEADDVIATLINHQVTPGKTLIISGDKDFIQLQSAGDDSVSQYSPVQKTFITDDNPSKYLFEHCIRGDASDGVPNFLSGDDALVSGTRQKQIRESKLAEWMMDPATMHAPLFCRNYKLIALRKTTIPENIQSAILDTYIQEQDKKSDRSLLLPYFIKNKLMNLMDVIHEF